MENQIVVVQQADKPERQPLVYSKQVSAIHRLRINVKSLAEEARIIRREVNRAGNVGEFGYRWELNEHRRGRLREEARYAHLALAFVRGQAYSRAERRVNSPKIDSRHLAAKISRYMPCNVGDVGKWLEEGKQNG